MKKFILYPFLAIFTLLFITILSVLGIFFFKPEWIINPKNLDWALSKQSVVTEWSWRDAELKFGWTKWNDRHIHGFFDDLCLKVDTDTIFVDTCIQEINWDFHLLYNFPKDFNVNNIQPLIVKSDKLIIKMKETSPEAEVEKTPFEGIDVYGYWKMLWYPIIPDMDFDFKKIELHMPDKIALNLKLLKTKEELTIEAMKFKLYATPDFFTITPPKVYPLPIDPIMGHKLHLFNFEVRGDISASDLALKVGGRFEAIDIDLSANLSLPIKDDPSLAKFRKDFFKTVEAKLTLKELNQNFKKYSTEQFSVLPAPLNVMEGNFIVEVSATEKEGDFIQFDVTSELDLASADQALNLVLDVDAPLNVLTFSPGAIIVDIGFNKVQLKLPRLSKTSLPPQFMPDARIVKKPAVPKEAEGAPLDLSIKLEAMNENALHLNTNLLDEALRLNFRINVEKGEMQKGFVKVLPLKTSVFRRPIHVEAATISFQPPLDPVIEAKVLFPLPIYKVTLELEGPISSPRFAFTSEPPLPQNDIFAVLLFGRPLTDLSPDDKTAAQRTNQILSQGIFSLSVLYFLAGSPVEYIGYDAESNNATASIGIDSKTSLRVEGGGQGVSSTGVRRSLGKGWFIDTSVEKTKTTTTTEERQSYGVMLERIIAY